MINVGVLGCGNISGIYFQNLTTIFDNVNVYACADLDAEKVQAAAKQWNVPHIMTLDEMLACPEIDIILNLTTPQFHYELNLKCLEAGKHVYVEKPLAMTYSQGKQLVDLAKEKGLYLGCAPDTFMGAGIQSCCALIRDGYIGEPVAGHAFMMCHGHESWHPAPEFYYKAGGGPLFDMGPYYLTALVNMLGEVDEVCGMNNKTFETRTITSEPLKGKIIDVEVDTHISALLRFKSGAIVTLTTSFDVWKHSMPCIEVYGTKGSIKVPDPNYFDGPVMCATFEDNEYKEMPLLGRFSDNSRGLGVSDMAYCIENKVSNRASGEQGLHVLEVMEAIIVSNAKSETVKIKSSYTKPDLLKRGESGIGR